MKFKKKWLIIAVCLSIGLFIALKIISPKKHNALQQSTMIIQPVMGKLSETVSTTGLVEPLNRLEIMPPISGRLENILVSEGDTVKKGQIVAMMSSSERSALIDASRFQSKEKQKYWEETYKPIPLITPIDGTVIVRSKEAGQTISPSEPVIVISDRLIIKALADETDIGNIKLNQSALITLDAYPDIQIKGYVHHIAYESKMINNVTMYQVYIIPETTPSTFKSGMNAEVNITINQKENALLIPLLAVKNENDTYYVDLYDPQSETQKRRIEIKIGLSNNTHYEIIDGLTLSSQVITEKNPAYSTLQKNNPNHPSKNE